MANSKFDSKSFNAEAFKYMVDRVPNLMLSARGLRTTLRSLTSPRMRLMRRFGRKLSSMCSTIKSAS